MARFGSFAEVIAAPRARLMEVKGVGEAVQSAQDRGSRRPALARPGDRPAGAVILGGAAGLLHGRDGARQSEEFRVLFLDRKNVLIADEVQNRGTVDHTPVYPREIVKRALELAASAIILMHNHPGGDPTPSKADIDDDTRDRGRRQGAGTSRCMTIW